MSGTQLGAAVFTICIVVSGARAAPCVGSDFATPFPGALNVTVHAVDVPSPRFPGFWQEGTKDGYFFSLFANGDAALTAGRDSSWHLSYSCDASLDECSANIEGSPPDGAMQVAEQLKQCLLEGEVSLPAEETEAPSPEEEPTNGLSEEPVSPALPEETQACGMETIDDENPTRKLQRMLILAGADPGPVDGIPGAMTANALVSVLGDAATQLTSQDAINALQERVCSYGDQ
ncbi:hypothetical protein DS901_12830 [Loktanella sp. D2R18]|uniref:peptidoglycan-binding domain-containing protein n=1 Tax=Rhodobacterales TaxID=204455 RepID=UPI000DEA9663|nr:MULTISPECIES: hypothetical protein [Rhodobacterales]MDO6591890.1 hypothetical protein [Yoonia sp. 1_MG-2023]RBW42680.1 hypothetical protein DS901_12830 [Loktanella sp. D2R18]